MTSILKVDTIQTAAGGTPTAADLGLNVTGSVLQVKQGFMSSVQTGTFGATWTDVTGLTVSITPTSSSSKILVTVDMKGVNDPSTVLRARLLRDSTEVGSGDASGNRPTGFTQMYFGQTAFGQNAPHVQTLSTNFLDSPTTTSQITYKVQVGGDGTGNTYYINRTYRDNNLAVTDTRVSSTITLMEIAG